VIMRAGLRLPQMMSRAVVVCVVGALAMMNGAPAFAATSPSHGVVAILRTHASYVDPQIYSAAVVRQVRADAAELIARGEKIKLAAIAPLGSQDIFVAASQIRDALKYSGTLVITEPSGVVGAAGPRAELSMRNAIAAVGATAITDPAARLLIVGEVATPPPTDNGAALRDLVLLVGLALCGAAAAIGWGIRREQHAAHRRAMEVRGVLRVYADALGARIAQLNGCGDGREALALIEAADANHLAAGVLITRATTPKDLVQAAQSLTHGFGDAARAGELIGIAMPADQPFAGLCLNDPAHGAAVLDADEREGLCAACADAHARGEHISSRRVTVAGQPVGYRIAPVPQGVLVLPEAATQTPVTEA